MIEKEFLFYSEYIGKRSPLCRVKKEVSSNFDKKTNFYKESTIS